MSSMRYDKKTRAEVRSIVKSLHSTHTYEEIANELKRRGFARPDGREANVNLVSGITQAIGLRKFHRRSKKKIASPKVLPMTEKKTSSDLSALTEIIISATINKGLKLQLLERIL